MIRLAAFDLDQTIISTNLVLSPRVREAVTRAQERGVMVTLVTGRDPKVTVPYARQLEITAPIVCYQGGLVYDFIKGEALYEVRLPAGLLPKIVEEAQKYHWNLCFEGDNRVYLPRTSNHPPIFYELIRLAEWLRVDDFMHDIPAVPFKFLVTLNHPDDRERVVSEMEKTFNGQLRVVPSHPYLVEGVPVGVDKGRGLAWLANYLQIPRDEVLAVGDNDNDVPMIEWAGVGVAVGNASLAARAAADWISPPVEEDGAADALEKYV